MNSQSTISCILGSIIYENSWMKSRICYIKLEKDSVETGIMDSIP